ncbi:LAFA_0B05908g1_1 [Lachancea sp. 'fantastica']|nr:LAFA_0B05908g1_1 [Lachancea sp. 'fantastica']
MSELQRLVWAGTLNLKIKLDPELVLTELKVKDQEEDRTTNSTYVNVQVPRDSYLILFLPHIIQKLGKQLRMNVRDYYQGWWFEMENVCIPWNFPIGALYDSFTGLNPKTRACESRENSINVWNLVLRYGKQLPRGFIPIRNGSEQIRELWMHQWKQACFVMNGNSKLVMSFSKRDTLSFWESVLCRSQTSFASFSDIRQRILPVDGKVKSVPVKIHLALPDIRLVEPVCSAYDNEREVELSEVLAREFPEWFASDGKSHNLAVPVIQGILVPLEVPLWKLYQQLASFDGFLHISLCLVADSDAP